LAVYRPTRRQRPPVLWLALGLIALVVVGGGAFLALRPAPTSDLATAKAALTEVSGRLDLLGVEYPKLVAGQANGAEAALTSAEAAWNRALPPLQAIDPAWATARQAQLTALKALVSARATPAEVQTAATALMAALATWQSTH
jgi:hypothetical protein